MCSNFFHLFSLLFCLTNIFPILILLFLHRFNFFIMIVSDFNGFYVVEVTNVYPPSVVYAGSDYHKAFRLFDKLAKRNSVELWINRRLIESRIKL